MHMGELNHSSPITPLQNSYHTLEYFDAEVIAFATTNKQTKRFE